MKNLKVEIKNRSCSLKKISLLIAMILFSICVNAQDIKNQAEQKQRQQQYKYEQRESNAWQSSENSNLNKSV